MVVFFLVGEAGLDFHFASQNKGSATSSRRRHHPTQFQIVIHFSSQSCRLRSEMNGLSHGLKKATGLFLHQSADWCRPFKSHIPKKKAHPIGCAFFFGGRGGS